MGRWPRGEAGVIDLAAENQRSLFYQEQAPFSVKGQTVHILGFEDPIISVATTCVSSHRQMAWLGSDKTLFMAIQIWNSYNIHVS